MLGRGFGELSRPLEIARVHEHLARADRRHSVERPGADVGDAMHALDALAAQEFAEDICLRLAPDDRQANDVTVAHEGKDTLNA